MIRVRVSPIWGQPAATSATRNRSRILPAFWAGFMTPSSIAALARTSSIELAQYSGVPVYNGLTNEFHPTQILADFLTMQEHVEKPLHQVSYVFVGDAGNNMGDSLLIGGAKMGMDVRLCAPKACWPTQAIQDEAQAIAGRNRARGS